jgi:Flp pilus assembly pilin Flp
MDYGVIGFLIAIAIIAAVTLIGLDVQAMFNTIAAAFPGAP